MAAVKAGTIFFEVKQGPYRPSPEQHQASWAPSEKDPDAQDFEKWYQKAQAGSIPPSRRSG
ncbi:MAG: hypothetical protein OEW15_15440 [Nitrospirota bacterium]|nr:hypothetical protein [Nitrospirota bacterium]